MRGIVERAVGYGITDQPPVERRRIRTINIVAWIACVINLLYNVIYLIVDPAGLLPVIVTNTISIVMYLTAIRINATGNTNLSMWLLFSGGLFNLTLASLLLGGDFGVPLFIMILPATAALIAPAGDLRIPMIVTGLSLLSFIVVVLVDTPTPASIAGTSLETALLVTSMVGIVLFIAVVGVYFRRLTDSAEADLQLANERNETLLLNILPEEIADRLKAGEAVIADRVEGVSVLFADLVDSTPMSERLSPTRMVTLLNEIFTPFDDLAEELGLEKIKTIGDAYMVVGGLPQQRPDHLEAIADMALRMRREIANHTVEGFGDLKMRYGIETGPVVAGVIGKKKFSYDLWGDTVNTAARMESHGVPDEIQVTGTVRDALASAYEFTERGGVEIKGKGFMTTYFLVGRITRDALGSAGNA